MKLMRVSISIITLVVIVCALAIVALQALIDPNQLRPVIAAEIQKRTGYNVVMDGDFTWSFYPRFGIKTRHIALSIPQHTNAFLDMQNVTFVMPLSELWQHEQKLRGDVYIASLQFLNVHAKHAHVGLDWQNDILTLELMAAQLYEGELEGVARGKSFTQVPSWKWDMQLHDVQLRPFLQDVNGVDSKLNIAGVGQLKIKGAALGATREQLLESLNGMLVFSLQHGSVEGIDINYIIKSANALINKQPAIAKTDKLEHTDFDNFSGTATINNGVTSSQDILFSAPTFTATGAGSINLPSQAINFQLHVTPLNTAKHWAIPVMISGNLLSPDVRLDATELNIMVAKQQLEEVKVKLRDQIKQRLSGKTGELMQNMLGG